MTFKPLLLLPVLAGALLAGSASAPQAQGSGQPQPGYWEYSTRVLGVGETEQKCVRQSEINRFFGGLSTRRWQCTYPVREVGGGAARFEGVCHDRRGRQVRVRLNGPYDSQSFRFTGGAQLSRGTPYIPASITARRIAAQCPAGAEYF
ncbi:MAG: DUF3617 family protein [Brevundimonas sp.]|nr:MAG: DUF3617 family protein [Brevundimonas sp.]